MAHPPRSNPPLRSSSGAPSPCITPSTETCVTVVSFMGSPFLLVVAFSFDRTEARISSSSGDGQDPPAVGLVLQRQRHLHEERTDRLLPYLLGDRFSSGENSFVRRHQAFPP